jgi:acyl-coenzyme A synthetase/AMP-(fatty) acid ligase
VVLKPGAERDAEELCKYVSDRLPTYKHLHGGVHFVEELPVNTAGKMDRKALLAMAIEKELSGW